MKKVLLFLALTFSSLQIALAANNLTTNLDMFMDNLSADLLIDNKSKKITADIKNAVDGMDFLIYRYGADIIHPITGANLGRQKIDLGSANITDGRDVKYTGKDNLTIGDKIEIKRPINVIVAFDDNVSIPTVSNIRVQLDRSRYFKPNTEATDYKLICDKTNLKVVKCDMIFKGKTIFSDTVDSSDFTLTNVLTDTPVEVDSYAMLDQSLKIDRDVTNISSGFVYGADNAPNLLLSDSTNVYIYDVGDNFTLNERMTIGIGFQNILSVEVLDIDEDGIDEIFISDLREKPDNAAVSCIYKYDGVSKFIKIADDIPFVFRTYYSAGKKHLITQTYYSSEFSGKIRNFGYNNGVYENISDIDNSLGYKIFGFGVASSGELISINTSGSLEVIDTARKFESSGNGSFADNNRYLFYKKEKVLGTKTGMNGNVTEMTETSTIAVPLMQRIIEIKNNMFLLSVNNILGSKVDQFNTFTSASLGIYSMIEKGLSDLFFINYKEPSILESDVLTFKNGTRYILSLVNINKDRYKTSTKGRVTVFKIVDK